jgi:hypothetical protein
MDHRKIAVRVPDMMNSLPSRSGDHLQRAM